MGGRTLLWIKGRKQAVEYVGNANEALVAGDLVTQAADGDFDHAAANARNVLVVEERAFIGNDIEDAIPSGTRITACSLPIGAELNLRTSQNAAIAVGATLSPAANGLLVSEPNSDAGRRSAIFEAREAKGATSSATTRIKVRRIP